MFKIAQGKSMSVHWDSYWKVEIFEIRVVQYRAAVVTKNYQRTFQRYLGKKM